MMPNNSSFYMGPQAGQGYFLAGEPVMPTGVQFEGVKFFESTNFPNKTVSATFASDGANTFADEEVAQGFFFGPQYIVIGLGGPSS